MNMWASRTRSWTLIENRPGIGEDIAESVAHFFEDKSNRDVLKRMKKSGLKVQPIPLRRQQPLKDKTFVFTGSLENFTRDEAKVHRVKRINENEFMKMIEQS